MLETFVLAAGNAPATVRSATRYPPWAASTVAGLPVTRRLFDVGREVFDRLTDARRAYRLSFRAGGHSDRSQNEHRRRQTHPHETLLLSLDPTLVDNSNIRLNP